MIEILLALPQLQGQFSPLGDHKHGHYELDTLQRFFIFKTLYHYWSLKEHQNPKVFN